MPEIIERPSSAVIRAVGDLCPGDYAVDGHGVGAFTRKFGCDYPFSNLDNFADPADILIANLEGVLSTRCRKENLRFGGLPEMAQAIRAAGFDIVSLANNHAFEHGEEVVRETIKCCVNAGLQVCGLRANSEYYCQPVCITRNGITFGFLAYNWVGVAEQIGAEQYLAMISDGVVNYTWRRDRQTDLHNQKKIRERNIHVLQDIGRLKKEVDRVVLLPHWGYEWTIYPPYGVVLEARTFIDAGVDLIIGAHPHVAQGIEEFKGKTIAYSLGNFLFDPQPEKQFNGMIFDCVIDKDGSQHHDFFAVKCDGRCQPEYATVKEQQNFKEIINRSTKTILSETAVKVLDDDVIYQKFEKGYNQRKIKKIRYLFFSMFKQPDLIIPVCKKIKTLLELLILRLRGQHVRW